MQISRKLFATALMGVCLALFTRCTTAESGAIFEEALRQMTGETGSVTQPLSQFEIETGLREALKVGADNVATQLGTKNGFWGDQDIQIPLPAKLQSVRDSLSKVGLSSPFDDLHQRANHAAESAMPEVKNLFVSAISQMTLQDVVGILNGGDGAATEFFKRTTEDKLRSAMTPFINTALEQASVFQLLDSLGSRYQLDLLVGDLKTDFSSHAVQYGLNGIFFYLEREETKIRQNPVARTSDILRRVFGSLDG